MVFIGFFGVGKSKMSYDRYNKPQENKKNCHYLRLLSVN